MGIKNIYDHIKAEVDRYGQRTEYLDKYSMDVKFASHLFRLYYEGLQILKEGRIDFPLAERKYLLAIKRGEYDLDTLLKKAEAIEPMFEKAYLESKLRHSPDKEAISKLQMDIYLKYWKNKGML